MDENDDWAFFNKSSNIVAPNLSSQSMNFENSDWDFFNGPTNNVAPSLGFESINFENDNSSFLNRPSNIVVPTLGSESMNFKNDDSGFLTRPSNIVVPSSESMNFETDGLGFLNRPSNIIVPSLGSESMNFENDDSGFINRPSNIVVPSLVSESMNFEKGDWNFLNRPSNVIVPNLGSEPMNFENGDSDFLNRPNNIVGPNLGSINFGNNDRDFFKRLLNVDITSSDFLDDVFSMDFSVAHQGTPYNQSSEMINTTTPVHIIADQFKTNMDQNDNQQMYLQHIKPVHDLNQQIFFPPPPLPTEVVESVPAPLEAIDLEQQLIDLERQLMCDDDIHPTFASTTRSPQIKTSERKNQPERIVYELLEEELANDTWRWRKYGRKKIRGTLFARNYYKCSTSDQCQARKLIEKSPKDDKIFLVAYSGTHNHDPPLSCSSVPGCSSSSKDKILKSISILPKPISLNASKRGGKRSRAAPKTDESTSAKKKKMVVVAGEEKVDGEEEDDMNEDVEELNGVTDDST